MDSIAEFIESGILELYVLGHTNAVQSREVEQMAAAYEQVRQELAAIRQVLENYAGAHARKPSPLVKTQLMASVDYYERLRKGEEGAVPPVLTANSRAGDFAAWLNRADMVPPADFSGAYAKIIAVTAKASTAIIWIQDKTEEETHHREHESFLIVEGTCAFRVGNQVHHLGPGDYFAVPLNKPHQVEVTSAGFCKAILQRVAA